MNEKCYVYKCKEYDTQQIANLIEKHIHVKQDEKVFIKPNWVTDPIKGKEDRWVATITNVSIIDAVLMVLNNKLGGKGHIIIGDSPMGPTNIKKIHTLIGIEEIVSKYRTKSLQIEIIDIRNYYLKHVKDMLVHKINLEGDPRGNNIVDLGCHSAFYEKENKNYGFVDNVFSVSNFHDEKHDSYVISQSVLDCDLFINLPKLKTHRSAGMTCAMKNLVGITANKNSVPHRTKGSDSEGGDTFSAKQMNFVDVDSESRGVMRKITKYNNPFINYLFVPIKIIYNKVFGNKIIKNVSCGYWHGNDTIWRSIIDLNRIVLYCDKHGQMQDTVQRSYLCIADAIVAGEQEGPLIPIVKKCNIILVSDNPVALDTVACKFMGFNIEKLPFLNSAYSKMRWPLVNFEKGDVKINSDIEQWNERFAISITADESFNFIPVEGWKGNI